MKKGEKDALHNGDMELFRLAKSMGQVIIAILLSPEGNKGGSARTVGTARGEWSKTIAASVRC